MTIHYEGRLRDVQLIDKLMEEVSDVAEALGWSHEAIREEELRGIILDVHEDCDPVALLVDPGGILRFPSEELDDASRQVFVKTRCAPADVHMAIVKLFRHLKERYFEEFRVDDDSGYWETGERWEFVKHHPSVSVLTDRLATTPADLAQPASDVGVSDLVERLEEALATVTSKDSGGHRDDSFEDDQRKVAFPEPEPPYRNVLLTWHVDDWIDYFERHDRSRNSLLGFMSGRAETDEEFALALRRSDAEDARGEARTCRLIRKWKRELENAREEDPAAYGNDTPGPAHSAEPWRASLPEFPEESYQRSASEAWSRNGDIPHESPSIDTTPYHRPSDEWDEIAAECPAFDEALDLMRVMARRDGEGGCRSPMLTFVKASISTTIIGVSMGCCHWSRSEGFPLARTARYVIASRRFDQISRLMARLETTALRELAPRARSIASGFQSAAEEGPGGRNRER